jgi:cholest-4-en-3-one 26-monooxygenase
MEESMAAVFAICDYGVKLAERRRLEPREDAISKVAAAFETEHLSEDELMGMMLLLAGAGNETTRNALSHGMHALMRHPEQMALLRSDTDAVIDTAVEEILRWSSPLIEIRRTAIEDIEIQGTHIAAGDPVALFFSSANFDETVFPDPQRFDITRSPNPHVAFGTGPHVCLGAAVARLEVKVMTQELLARTSRIDQTGPIEYARDSFLRGVKRLPVSMVAA